MDILEDFQNAIIKLDNIKKRYEELNEKLADVNVINNHQLFKEYSIELSSIEELVHNYQNFQSLTSQLAEAEEMLKTEQDKELQQMAQVEVEDLSDQIIQLKGTLKMLLIPPDPMADKNIIVEIRAGTGGDESALFAGELFRMYSRYAEKKRWKIEVMDSNETELGGYKEMVFSISGKKVFENLKYEYGGHRVQRIPVTESGGRVHTSAVTVAIMPEAEAADVEIKDEDLRIDVLRASGAGGQHVNKTESAVRITHIPTGIAVKCQDNRSQHQNKNAAMKVLRSRLYEIEMIKLQDERAEMRKSQVGSGDRSDKIRTYNFPQNRVTDHRINLTLYKLDMFMLGEIEEMIEALKVNMLEEEIKNI
ncbi:MAG: peptide chain release factor 1 [Spirochaetes bacterium]|nr:peptide chain release factor 1 [Spirochaetota bacterium]